MPSYLSNWAGTISNPTMIDSAVWLQYIANASSLFQSAPSSIDRSSITYPTSTTAKGSFYNGSTFEIRANSFNTTTPTVTRLTIHTTDSMTFRFEGNVTVNVNSGSENGSLNHIFIENSAGEKLDVFGKVTATSNDAIITKLKYHGIDGGTIELKGALTYHGLGNSITGNITTFSYTDIANHGYQLKGLSVTFEQWNSYKDMDAFVTGMMAGNDVLNGTSGADVLRSFDGNDTITGGAGSDIIIGGVGADSLDGGAGNDTVSYSGSSAAVTVSINGSNVTTGSGGDAEGDSLKNFENISGSNHNDTLTGDAAANTLNGFGGDDTMTGGAGNDIYFVDSSTDVIVEKAAGGMDLVYSSAYDYTLADNVETLILTGGAVKGYGNALGNTLIGNNGDNYLTGGDGRDFLLGGAGNDTLDGRNGGADVLRGSKGDDNYGVSLIKKGAQAVLEDDISEALNQGVDTLTLFTKDDHNVQKDLGLTKATTITLPANFENLDASYTGVNKLNFTGNALNNVITGNNADNLISGGAGDDTLDGREGNDTLTGGAGHDKFAISALGAGNADTITDFTSGIDKILLDTTIINGLTNNGNNSLSAAEFANSGTANSTEQRIIYNPATGKLYYDNDGNGANAQVEIATVGINTHPALNSSDFFVDWGA